jgi:hypothetical protein
MQDNKDKEKLRMKYRVQDNTKRPGGGRDFLHPPVQTGPGAHPVSCTVDTDFFTGR